MTSVLKTSLDNMRNSTKANASVVIDEAKAAKSHYDGMWATLHRAIGDYYIPQNSAINTLKTPDTAGWTEGIFDTTAVHAAQTFTAGCYDYMLSGEFFDFEAPKKDGVSNPIAKDWYHKCAEIVLELINESNWALKIQEHLQDRNTFGTANIDLEQGKNGTLYSFATTQVGKFFPQSNDDGYIDTMFYCYDWTAKKIVDKFGEDNVSSDVMDAYKDDSRKAKEKFKLWRKVAPRPLKAREAGKIDALNKEFESVWVEEKAKHVLYESGYDEQPFVGSRFAQWGDEEFGWSPAILIMPSVRTLQDIMKSLVTIGEISVWPRTMVPDTLKDVIQWEAGGVTVYPDSSANAPQVWGEPRGYAEGKDLVTDFREMIKDAYHVDLFKALAERTKTMTATEVLELVQEKLVNFRPTFARFTSETLDTLLQRMFKMAFRDGRFPPVPPEVIVESNGELSIPEPRPTYVSKIARAMRALENKSTLDFLQQVAFLLEVDPMLLYDNYNLDAMMRGFGDNNSLPTEYKRPEKQRNEIRAARQQQAEQQQAMEMAKQGSEAARNLGQVPAGARKEFADAIDV